MVAWLPAVMFLASSLAADLVALTGHDPIGILPDLPIGPLGDGWLNAELSGTASFLVALALLRSKRVGLWLALGALAGGFLVQGPISGHPVGAAAAAISGGILVLARDRYTIRSGSTRKVAGLVVAGGLLAVGGATVGMTAGVAMLLARLLFVMATFLALEPAEDPRTQEEVERAHAVLQRLGRGALLPYQLDDPAVPFATQDGRGVLAFARAGRVAVMLGDPVGEPTPAFEAVVEWIRTCKSVDWLPVLYQASDELAARLTRSGAFSCRIGSEAVLDPAAFDLRSARLANVRHTVTRSRRGGIRAACSIGDGELHGLPSMSALAALDEDWRRRAGPTLGFTVGRFDPDRLADALVAVAVEGSGTPVAFTVLRAAGSDGSWMLDLIRRRGGSVPGAVEAALVTAIELLASIGVRRLSLGLAPLAGLSRPGASLAERILGRAARVARPIYDVAGLAFFKNKFAPWWEPRYLIVPRWWDLPAAVVALLRLHFGVTWPPMVRSLAAALTPKRRRSPEAPS